MSIELQYLRIVKYRRRYAALTAIINPDQFQLHARKLIEGFGRYFDKVPSATVIKPSEFLPMFFSWYPKLDMDMKRSIAKLIKLAMQDLDDDVADGIVEGLAEQGLAARVAQLLAEYDDGECPDFHALLADGVRSFQSTLRLKASGLVDTPIEELLLEDLNDDGLHPRLSCLKQSMRPLRGGDFLIAAGRPDRGKTTFLASEITHMAAQLPADRPVLWLNNEGPGSKIKKRVYQAALGLNMSEMLALMQRRKLNEAYEEAVGTSDKVRVFDVHGRDMFMVERLMDQHTPGIVVFDMLDNVRGYGGEARADQRLEKLYQGAREMCVQHDVVGFAASQISQEGDGMNFPTLAMLKESKTAKQGACDVQIMIGSSNSPALSDIRYIGLPKNKLHREGAPSDPRAEVAYKPQIARYVDMDANDDDVDEE